MQSLYLILMSGVSLAILVSLVEAVRAVSSKRGWEPLGQRPMFVERRTQSLPYVGVERRKDNHVIPEAAPASHESPNVPEVPEKLARAA